MDWLDSIVTAAGSAYSSKTQADQSAKNTKATLAGQKTALALVIGGALLIVVVLVLFLRRK